MESGFGSRQSPSLAEALMRHPANASRLASPALTPPMLISPPRNSFVKDIAVAPVCAVSQSPIRRFDRVDSMLQSQQSTTNYISVVDDIEQQMYDQLDRSLKQHYKIMKAKLKKIQCQVSQTDATIHKLQKMLSSITDQLIDLDPCTADTQPVESPKPKYVWKRNNRASSQNIYPHNYEPK